MQVFPKGTNGNASERQKAAKNYHNEHVVMLYVLGQSDEDNT